MGFFSSMSAVSCTSFFFVYQIQNIFNVNWTGANNAKKKWLMDAHLTLFAVFIHRWFFSLSFCIFAKHYFEHYFFRLHRKFVSKSIYFNVKHTDIRPSVKRDGKSLSNMYIERSYENRPLLLCCHIFDGYALMYCGIHS